MVVCDCGCMYAGEGYYYSKKYCDNCGRWLHWDKHSDISPSLNQYQSNIDVRDYREEEWA